VHRFERAIVRAPAANFADGLTTVAWTSAPSWPRLRAQHRAYVEALRGAGLDVEELDPLARFPDAYFVEDVAVVVPELAIVTRPGADERRGEAEHIVEALARVALAPHRELARLAAPATLDGGDVLVADRRVFVGLSVRTNEAGVAALAELLEPHGYAITPVPLADGLHLKSSVNLVGPGLLVATPSFVARPELAGFEILATSEAEAYAANVLRVNDHLLVAAGFPDLHARLRGRGLELVELDMSEVEKMDGGLTCLSLRL
jgi:dimethylargininase